MPETGSSDAKDLEGLSRRALAAAENAYAPYSGFRVGAALRLESGEIVTGANVENASYGLTICAERSALVRAIAEYGPRIRLAAAAVANLNHADSPPCGACRQMLAEFAGTEMPVIFPFAGGAKTMTINELLPMAFVPKDLI